MLFVTPVMQFVRDADAFSVLVRKEGAAVLIYSVFLSMIHAMSVLESLTGCSNGLARGAILKRILNRLYGLCVFSLCQLDRLRNSDKNVRCSSGETTSCLCRMDRQTLMNYGFIFTQQVLYCTHTL